MHIRNKSLYLLYTRIDITLAFAPGKRLQGHCRRLFRNSSSKHSSTQKDNYNIKKKGPKNKQ